MPVKTWMPEQHKLTDVTRERMNVPSEFWRASVDGVEAKAVLDDGEQPARAIAKHMVSNARKVIDAGGGVFITGPAGIGKSSLAALVAKAAQCWGAVGYFTGIWELRENLRSRAIFDGDTSIMDRCRSVDVLVLDHLRAEDTTDFILDTRHIEELVSYRAAHGSFTIITSRLSLDDLTEKKAGALADTLNMRLVTLKLTGDNRTESATTGKRATILGVKG